MSSLRTALNSSARSGATPPTSFALFQAAAAYGFSWLFARDGDYPLLFRLGGAAVTLALAIELVMALTGAQKAAR